MVVLVEDYLVHGFCVPLAHGWGAVDVGLHSGSYIGMAKGVFDGYGIDPGVDHGSGTGVTQIVESYMGKTFDYHEALPLLSHGVRHVVLMSRKDKPPTAQ